MKKTEKTKKTFGFMALAGLFMVAGQAVAEGSSAALEYLCASSGGDYNLQLSPGQAQRVTVHSGGLLQVQEPVPAYPQQVADRDNLLASILASGITEGCARLLVDQANVALLQWRDGQQVARVYFDFDRSGLSARASQVLDGVIDRMKASGRFFAVDGHTDSVGSEGYNLALGKKRAQTVSYFLVDKGINPQKLALHSLGEQAPVASNSDSKGRQQNRRVDITVTDTP